jgi:hypothetical protein
MARKERGKQWQNSSKDVHHQKKNDSSKRTGFAHHILGIMQFFQGILGIVHLKNW